MTAAMVDARDFIAARKRADQTVLIPEGTRIAITGGTDYHDHRRIWAALDKVHARPPHMVLLHGGTPSGAEHIADCWARNRQITAIAFKPDRPEERRVGTEGVSACRYRWTPDTEK